MGIKVKIQHVSVDVVEGEFRVEIGDRVKFSLGNTDAKLLMVALTGAAGAEAFTSVDDVPSPVRFPGVDDASRGGE